MKRVLVTGGTGFIGSNLVARLEALGIEVVNLDHQVTPEFQSRPGFRQVDVTNPFEIEGPLDVVFHQASLTDPRYANDQEMYQMNTRGFANIVALAQKKGAKLVYASTAGLYGNGPVPMREDQPKHILTVYGQSKMEMDEKVPTLASEMGVVGLRYFNVFGPGESLKGRPASMIYHLAKQMRQGARPRIFNFGEQRRDHIYVNDVVEANLRAVEAPSGVYNVGTGIGTSFNELVAVLNDVMGTHLEPEYFPMPYDPETYQHCTIADTTLATSKLKFTAGWALKPAIADYLARLG
jgi:ADP-L-glycero-D-manno-heptose 6-epimerase